MVLDQDFREFIELLNKNEVRYLVVGGYAVGLHGYPRYTKDLDIWIAVDAENARRMMQVINEFGFADSGLSESDFFSYSGRVHPAWLPASSNRYSHRL